MMKGGKDGNISRRQPTAPTIAELIQNLYYRKRKTVGILGTEKPTHMCILRKNINEFLEFIKCS